MTDLPGENENVFSVAADILERDGWCQGANTDREGRHCLVGALRKAWEDELGWIWTSTILDSLSTRLELGGEWPSSWNDELGRTASEVISLLREAAAAPEASLRGSSWLVRGSWPWP